MFFENPKQRGWIEVVLGEKDAYEPLCRHCFERAVAERRKE